MSCACFLNFLLKTSTTHLFDYSVYMLKFPFCFLRSKIKTVRDGKFPVSSIKTLASEVGIYAVIKYRNTLLDYSSTLAYHKCDGIEAYRIYDRGAKLTLIKKTYIRYR